MDQATKEIDRPRLAIVYALIITISSIVGLLGFIILYFTNADHYLAKINISPIILGMSLLIFSFLGLLTGSGLLFRKKFGWILAQFLLLFIIISSLYSIVLLPIFRSTFSTEIFFDFLEISILFVVSTYLVFYFNQKRVFVYYGIEKEEANRLYLINFLSCILILFIGSII